MDFFEPPSTLRVARYILKGTGISIAKTGNCVGGADGVSCSQWKNIVANALTRRATIFSSSASTVILSLHLETKSARHHLIRLYNSTVALLFYGMCTNLVNGYILPMSLLTIISMLLQFQRRHSKIWSMLGSTYLSIRSRQPVCGTPGYSSC